MFGRQKSGGQPVMAGLVAPGLDPGAIPKIGVPCPPERDRPRIKSGGDKPGDDECAATTFAPPAGRPRNALICLPFFGVFRSAKIPRWVCSVKRRAKMVARIPSRWANPKGLTH